MSALTVRLSDSEHESLRLYARREGRSVQAVVRDAISEATSGTKSDRYGAFDSEDSSITSDWDGQMRGFGEWR